MPKSWSDTLAENLRSAGRDVSYIEYPYEGHEFATQWSDFMQKTAAFFTKNLRTISK